MGILSLADGHLGRIDRWYFAYHCYRNRTSPAMFHEGWGNHAAIETLTEQWQKSSVPPIPDVVWDHEWLDELDGTSIRNGRFAAPAYREYLPPESRTAFFRFVRPQRIESDAVALLTPTSREAGVESRMPIARGLAERGISTILLESPLMGRRRSAHQSGTTLSHFSDFLVLSGACIEEARGLIAWLGQQPFKNVCVAGISKGGYLATVAGLRSAASVRTVSMVAPHSGVPVLLEGLLGRLCDWDMLQRTSGSVKPVRQLMAEVFDRTSLERLSMPLSTQDAAKRLIAIGARRDRYVPASSYERMQAHWGRHADFRWLPGGHVSSIFERRHFVEAISQALQAAPPNNLSGMRRGCDGTEGGPP